MDVPMERVLNAPPCTIAYERGDWNRVACDGLVADVLASAYLESIAWADEISGSLR